MSAFADEIADRAKALYDLAAAFGGGSLGAQVGVGGGFGTR
jgi:hypothetical protein